MNIPETPVVGPSWDFNHGELKIAGNRRYIAHADGTPFVWIGDRAWELFHRYTKEEAEQYLENRRKKGFTVICAALLSPVSGLAEPNPQRHRPLAQTGGQWDPAKPEIHSPSDYWTDAEQIIKRAEQLGMYMGLLPAWGSYVTGSESLGAFEHPRVFSRENAYTYGKFLGKRFQKARNIIWILGGGSAGIIQGKDYRPTWRAMAEGLGEGFAGQRPTWDRPHAAWDKTFMTYYSAASTSSGEFFHGDAWLDLNMAHSGHSARAFPNHETIAQDYAREPAKPVLDGGPCYENQPVNLEPANGYFDDADVRQAAYWSMFAGACGFTYGCNDVWQKFTSANMPLLGARTRWQDALELPAAWDMLNLRRLLLSRPYISRVPSYSTIAAGQSDGPNHLQATRGDGYCLVYVPAGNAFTINLEKVTGATVRTWWYNPRTSAAQAIGDFPNQGTREFTPPGKPGHGNDWVLVVDDAARNFPAPGTRSISNR